MTSGTARGTDTGPELGAHQPGSTGTRRTRCRCRPATAAANRYNVNLPVANPAGSLAFMLLGSDYIVDLELSAAQAEGRGEVVSSPRIITANQKEATIEQGTEIPYQEAASSGATTIQFKKAVLSLTVTPLITPDNRIILDLVVTKDSVGQVVVTSGGVNVPSIDTRTLTTHGAGRRRPDRRARRHPRDRAPRDRRRRCRCLGDIPVLGHLFKTTSKVNNKDELLIFVTPKILREGVNGQLRRPADERSACKSTQVIKMRKLGWFTALAAAGPGRPAAVAIDSSLAAAAAGGGSGGAAVPAPASPDASRVTSAQSIPSDGSAAATITAFVRDAEQSCWQACR